MHDDVCICLFLMRQIKHTNEFETGYSPGLGERRGSVSLHTVPDKASHSIKYLPTWTSVCSSITLYLVYSQTSSYLISMMALC